MLHNYYKISSISSTTEKLTSFIRLNSPFIFNNSNYWKINTLLIANLLSIFNEKKKRKEKEDTSPNLENIKHKIPSHLRQRIDKVAKTRVETREEAKHLNQPGAAPSESLSPPSLSAFELGPESYRSRG